jgi:hypothetical protein
MVAERAPDPSAGFGDPERSDNLIVGARLQSCDPVGLRSAAGQQEDGDFSRLAAQLDRAAAGLGADRVNPSFSRLYFRKAYGWDPSSIRRIVSDTQDSGFESTIPRLRS